ncbi:uncharacterized protein TNCV_1607671 [Trichonephila clavipes]|nr:uncharacterized protein TNCV_1607671 [Trichonephila clavipes]
MLMDPEKRHAMNLDASPIQDVSGILLGASFLCPPLAAATIPLAISGSVISTAGSGVVVGTSGTQLVRLKKKLRAVKTLIEREEKEFSGLKNWFTFTEVLTNTIEALVGPELIQDMDELRNNFFDEVRRMGCDNVDEYNKKFRSVMEKCVRKMCDSSYIRDKFDTDAAPFVIAFVFVICFMSKRYRGVLDCALLTRRLALEKSTAKNLGLETGQVVTGLALKGSAAVGRAVPALVARVVAVGVFVALGIAVDVLSVVLSSKEIHTGAKSKHADEVSRVVELLEEEYRFLNQRIIQRAFVIVNDALTKRKSSITGKLFHQNGSNHLAALREYRLLKELRKGPISKIGLRKMIMKFVGTRGLGVLPGRERKLIGTGDVAIAVVERASSSIYSSTRDRSVLRELE